MQFAAELGMRRAVFRRGRSACRRGGVRVAHLGGSLHRSLRHRAHYSGHSSQIAYHHRQLEVLIDALEAAINRLPNPADGLAPAEMLLDAFADDLADPV